MASTTKKIVVLGPTGVGYTNSIAHGLRINGYEVAEYVYLDPPSALHQVLLWRVLPKNGFDFFPSFELQRTLRKVERACVGASLLLLIKGDGIPLETLGNLVSDIKCPTVTWYMDAIEGVREGLQRARISKFLLYFEGTDFQGLRAESIPSLRVDLAYDPRWYFPLNSTNRVYDFSFVGSLYPERLSLLEELGERISPLGLKSRIYGSYVPRYRPWGVIRFSRTYPNVYKSIKQKRLAKHSEINTLNNRSKIALNILHNQSKDSLNIRTFESVGSGCFLLMQQNPSLQRCFEAGKDMETFGDVEEAIEKIRYYVRNATRRELIAQAGFGKASSKHTIAIRMKEIMTHLLREGVI